MTDAAFVGDKDELVVCTCDDGSIELWGVAKQNEKVQLIEHAATQARCGLLLTM